MMNEPFPLEGEVERYLNNLTDAMKMTLKLKMQEGYDTAATWDAGGDPRHLWLFNFPAQTVVTCRCEHSFNSTIMKRQYYQC